jgi:hypothetical protein
MVIKLLRVVLTSKLFSEPSETEALVNLLDAYGATDSTLRGAAM